MSDPATGMTRVRLKGDPRKSWTIPGWHRWIFVSNDGVSVAVGHDGMNLLPLDVTLREPVLRFYRRGVLMRTVTLGDLYSRKSQLQRTESHLAWCEGTSGVNRADQLVIDLVNGKRVAYGLGTGQVQRLDRGTH